jgi:hypothetical protein
MIAMNIIGEIGHPQLSSWLLVHYLIKYQPLFSQGIRMVSQSYPASSFDRLRRSGMGLHYVKVPVLYPYSVKTWGKLVWPE